jgi:hypothetical protein
MLPARRAARALRGLRPAKPAPVSRAKSQVWAGNDAWRRAPPTSRSFSDKNPLEPEVLAEPAPVSAEALDRARTAHDRAMEDFRAKLLAECDEMVVRGALPKLSTAQKSLLVDWNLSSE